MKRPPTILWICASLSGVAAIWVFVWFGYFAPLFISSTGSGEGTQNSALLPVHWETYRTDAWSVGYPTDFDVHTRNDGAVWFSPSGIAEKKTSFLVTQIATTLSAYKIAREADGYLDPTDVTISNYPAAKYLIGNGRTEYAISYHDRVIVVVSDDIDDETIAIMFATFSMNTN